MSESFRRTRTLITADTCPAMPRHIKLRHDAGRGRWILLAPERLFDPDETAVSVLKLCDGKTSVADIVTALSKEYSASPQEIQGDVIAMLQDLADKGVLINSAQTPSA
jgi:pyrroloquinoline quinone biosynthesis protein D